MSIIINTNKGGGTQNWDNVLSQGGYFTANRSFQFDDHNLTFDGVGQFNLNLSGGGGYFNIDLGNNIRFQFYNIGINKSLNCTDSNGDPNYFYLNWNTNDNVIQWAVGDFQQTFNGTFIRLQDDTQEILLNASSQTTLETSVLTFQINELHINRTTVGGAHLTSGQYLPVVVNGVTYYLQLFN
jgi:hypothetical protein